MLAKLKKTRLDTQELICMWGLSLFMVLFTGYSMVTSSNAAYRITHKSLFHLKSQLMEHIVPIYGNVFIQIGILLCLAWGLVYILKAWELPTVSVVVPLFILLTVSALFQDYVRRESNSWKHFLFLLGGLLVMLFGIIYAKHQSYEDERKSRYAAFLFRCICILTVVFAVLVIVGYVTKSDVNGAYGIIQFGPISFTPVELLKLLILLYAGVGLTELRLDERMKWEFILWMCAADLVVFFSKDFGNLIILMFLNGIIFYLLDAKFLIPIEIGACGAATAFVLVLNHIGWLPSWLAYTVKRLYSPFVVAKAVWGDSTKQALLAALRNGIFGGGADTKMFVDNIFAVYTDYAFIAIQAIFGVGISFLVILSYVVLFYGLSTSFKDTMADPMLYVYSNTVSAVLMVQTIIHVAVNLDVFPDTGIVLPFISNGGTSLLASFLCLGMILGVRVGDSVYNEWDRWIKKTWFYKLLHVTYDFIADKLGSSSKKLSNAVRGFIAAKVGRKGTKRV